MISEWHQRMHGVVPRHVELFGRLHPEAYKVQRIRYEKSIGKAMPAQLAPLMTLHLAAHYLWTGVMRQAIHQARVLGARRHHVVHTLLMGLRQSIDPMVMEVVAEEVELVKQKLPALMASVAQLDVPLLAEVGVGANWEEAH